VQHEQDAEGLENKIGQVRFVRHGREERRIDRVPELWADASAVVGESRRPVQRTVKLRCFSIGSVDFFWDFHARDEGAVRDF
jgi:hypothetical protein